jgi:hypothetical protein
MKRPWRIEYRNNDGHRFDFRSTFSDPMRAMEKAHLHWFENHAELDSGAVMGWVAGTRYYQEARETSGHIVHSDGFHTYTVYHRDSVVYG